MKKMALATVLACSMVLVGCEEKKPAAVDSMKKAAGDATKAAGDAGKAMGDAAKKAADATTDAAKKTADAAKDSATKAADATKDMANKAAETMKGEVMGMVDKIKAQMATLTKGGEALPADKKADFTKALGGLTDQFKGVQDAVSKLGGQSGEGMMKSLGDIKTMGGKLMDGVKATADKFGIKL